MTDEAQLHGERMVMWDRSAIDWGWLGTAPRIAARLDRVRAGDIVLMHDGQKSTIVRISCCRLCPDFLRELERRGLRV